MAAICPEILPLEASSQPGIDSSSHRVIEFWSSAAEAAACKPGLAMKRKALLVMRLSEAEPGDRILVMRFSELNQVLEYHA